MSGVNLRYTSISNKRRCIRRVRNNPNTGGSFHQQSVVVLGVFSVFMLVCCFVFCFAFELCLLFVYLVCKVAA